MKRIVKRVPMNFNWPLAKVWKGYVNPFPQESRKKHGEWKPCEPPKGKGWQLWEITTEGSPISPVFSSAERLAEWCEKNATVFAGFKTTKEDWLEMFKQKRH